MGLGFLSAIPGILGHGIGAIGGGIKKIPGVLGKMGGGDDEESLLTPGWNPAASMPVFGQQKKPGALSLPSPIKPATQSPQGQATPMTMDRPSPLALPIPIPGGDPAGRSLPAPTEAAPITDPILAAKAAHNAQYKEPQGVGQRLKGALIPALKGGLQGFAQTGDIGGFIGGAAGRGILAGAKPFAEHQMQFELEQKPKILAEQARQRDQVLFDEARRKAALDEQYRNTQIAQEQAQTAGMPSADEARAQREAELKYKGAQTTSVERGKPSFQTIRQPDGSLVIVQRNADGTQEVVGQSGAAEMKAQDRTSREKIAKERNDAAMARTQVQEGGKNARQARSAASGGGKDFISISQIRAAVARHNKDNPGARMTVQDMTALAKKRNPKLQVVK